MRSSDAMLPHLRLLVSIPHFDVFLQASQNRSAKKSLAEWCLLRQMERKSRTTKVSSQWPSSEALDEVRDMVEKQPWPGASQLAILTAFFVSSDFVVERRYSCDWK